MKNNCCDCCYTQCGEHKACGCCTGIAPSTPLSTANRPGLSQLSYRIGSHASFFNSMLARLSNSDLPKLAELKIRDRQDPAIALLDSWATVADVLTFYQERIANEGYLRCAIERRSILELARLVGYKLRPGVSASVFLAYTIDDNTTGEVVIPAGSGAQSIPEPGELPQTFETSEDIKARAKWNNLRPRMTQPQSENSIKWGTPYSSIWGPRIYLKGVDTQLKVNSPLLIQFSTWATPVFYRVMEVIPDALADRTLVTLRVITPTLGTKIANEEIVFNGNGEDEEFQVALIKDLIRPPSLQPANSLRLRRRLSDQFSDSGGAGYRTVGSFEPKLRDKLSVAAANAQITGNTFIKVYALRTEAPLFGYNVPKRTKIEKDGRITIIGDWPIIEEVDVVNGGGIRIEHEEEMKVHLDAQYEGVRRFDWVVVETQDTRLTGAKATVARVNSVDNMQTRSKYGITGPTTAIEINEQWITIAGMTPTALTDDDFNAIRTTTVYTQPEKLELAEEPIEAPVCGGIDELLELDGFYDGLESGRWVIVSGEREIDGTSGVRFSELAMLSSVIQDVAMDNGYQQPIPRPGEKIHTFIKLANELSYCFKRDTVRIYGNVVKATHGETRNEVLGSGEGSKAFQSFALKQSPLTHVSAANPTGVDSTLSVFVNSIRWREADALAGLQAKDRNFVTAIDDDGKAVVIFGNGREGARLPTGVENIRAVYRNGIGRNGNVKEEQISLLKNKPLGVKEVINPLRASGGADRENRDQARKSAPLAVKALDRLVSVRDYQDFARLFGGIGKAAAVEISDGRSQLVHVTIAGAGDIPIDETSDLFINLLQALRDFGDPYQPVQLATRELLFMVISADVQIHPDYLWEPVVAELRNKLLEHFSFENQELGEDVVLSKVISVMQVIPGVVYVDVDVLGGVPERIPDDYDPGNRRLLSPDEIVERVQGLSTALARLAVNTAAFEEGTLRPAQIAYLTPEVPETLILNQIK